jgi:hypothetical protein
MDFTAIKYRFVSKVTFKFSGQNFVRISHLAHAFYMPPHLTLLYLIILKYLVNKMKQVNRKYLNTENRHQLLRG